MSVRSLTGVALAGLLLAGAGPALAQQSDSITAGMKNNHDGVRDFILRAAEQAPEEMYGFQPTPEVRTMGRLFGHIANANFMICGAATGDKGPGEDFEKTATTKAALQKALADSFAFCDKAYASMTDARGAEPVKFFGGQRARLSVLAFNTAHNYEHYGNVVTYMRLKGMVPPSSAGR